VVVVAGIGKRAPHWMTVSSSFTILLDVAEKYLAAMTEIAGLL
jgi:hypothetical protein